MEKNDPTSHDTFEDKKEKKKPSKTRGRPTIACHKRKLFSEDKICVRYFGLRFLR